jgi:hypothetical protein
LKRILAISVAAATIAALAIALSASGGASASGSGARTLHLTFQTSYAQTFEQPPEGESAGDLSVFGGTLRSGGKAAGKFQAECVHVSSTHSQCSLTGAVHGGQIAAVPAYGPGFSGTQPVSRYPIVGGTGAFQNARGYIVEQDTAQDSGSLTIHLTSR